MAILNKGRFSGNKFPEYEDWKDDCIVALGANMTAKVSPGVILKVLIP